MNRPTVRNVSLTNAALSLSLLLGACSNEDTTQMSAGQIFYEAACASCHGESGLGDGPMAELLPVQPPILFEHLGHHPAEQLVQLIRSGLPPAMPPAPLTDDEIQLVIDYMWELVPDSLIAELREMQREAELGISMDMPEDDINGQEDSSASGMSGMTHSEQMEPSDTNKN